MSTTTEGDVEEVALTVHELDGVSSLDIGEPADETYTQIEFLIVCGSDTGATPQSDRIRFRYTRTGAFDSTGSPPPAPHIEYHEFDAAGGLLSHTIFTEYLLAVFPTVAIDDLDLLVDDTELPLRTGTRFYLTSPSGQERCNALIVPTGFYTLLVGYAMVNDLRAWPQMMARPSAASGCAPPSLAAAPQQMRPTEHSDGNPAPLPPRPAHAPLQHLPHNLLRQVMNAAATLPTCAHIAAACRALADAIRDPLAWAGHIVQLPCMSTDRLLPKLRGWLSRLATTTSLLSPQAHVLERHGFSARPTCALCRSSEGTLSLESCAGCDQLFCERSLNLCEWCQSMWCEDCFSSSMHLEACTD